MTGTPSARALPTSALMLAMTSSRPGVRAMTFLDDHEESRAGTVRRVVMIAIVTRRNSLASGRVRAYRRGVQPGCGQTRWHAARRCSRTGAATAGARGGVRTASVAALVDALRALPGSPLLPLVATVGAAVAGTSCSAPGRAAADRRRVRCVPARRGARIPAPRHWHRPHQRCARGRAAAAGPLGLPRRGTGYYGSRGGAATPSGSGSPSLRIHPPCLPDACPGMSRG